MNQEPDFSADRREQIQSKAFAIYLCGPSPEGKFYVGRTRYFSRRVYNHENGITYPRANYQDPLLQAAITKYGWNCLQPGIIAQTDIAEEAVRLEKGFIAEFNSLFPHGYNSANCAPRSKLGPAPKIASFEDVSVSEAEIKEAGLKRQSLQVCGVCGSDRFPFVSEVCDFCGVGFEFAKNVLAHLVERGAVADFVLPSRTAAKKSFRASRGVGTLIDLQKGRLGLRKIDEALPQVATEYAARLLPYIYTSLKRDVLAQKGIGEFTLGTFRPLEFSLAEASAKLATYRYLRKHRREMGFSVASNASVFASALFFYGTTKQTQAAIVEAITERGGGLEEISEAKIEAAFLSEIKLRERHQAELEQYLPQTKSEPLVSISAGVISLRLSLDQPPEIERAFKENLFAGDLDNMCLWEEKLALFLCHPSLTPPRMVFFHSFAARRAFVHETLKMSPPQRLAHAQGLVSNPNAGFVVKEHRPPQPVTLEAEECDDDGETNPTEQA